MFWGLVILNIIIAGVAVALGLFLLLGQGRDKQRLLFGSFNIATGVWIIANYFGTVQVYPLILTDYISGSCMGLLFWLFSREMRQRVLGAPASSRGFRRFIASAGFVAVAILIVMILTGEVINISPIPGSGIDNQSLYFAYPFIVLTFVVLAINNLVRAWLKARNRIQKTRVKLVLTGLSIAFVCVAIPNLILQNILPENSVLLIASYDLGYVGILILLIYSTYGIIKHGLFDIKFAAVRSLAYILSLVSMTVVYFLLAYVASVFVFRDHVSSGISLSPVNIVLALILAFIFQPLKRFFDKITNDFFYRDAYSSDVFFAKLSELLTSTTDLRGLLERASNEIATTFKSDQAFFHLHYTNGREHHMSTGTVHHANLPHYDSELLDTYVKSSSDPIFLTELLADEYETIRRMLQSHRIGLVMPLRLGDRIIGYLLLGEPLSANYTKRDLNVLSTISNELVIAIQNALSLHEVKELNATLQQRIDVATKELRSSNAQLKHLDEMKDEFMSMASHQLRTPLTSVKGYISMVLEGDAGKVSPQQDRLLLEAFKSSERMVGLIGDFLNVSRLQTGKFTIEKTPFDMGKIVSQEVNNLKLMSTSHDLKLKLHAEHGKLPVLADESKIRQVIMNFIDNAIYYSKPKSTILINVEHLKDEVAVSVVDTGIGVPEDEQDKLFNKFFRAKNARKERPDGTGVGLYLARRVVAAHKGSLIFSSKEGKGSTFGFRLPLDHTAPTAVPVGVISIDVPEPAKEKELALTR